MLCLFGKLKVLTNGLLRKHIIEAWSLLEWLKSKLIKEKITDKLKRSILRFDINIYVKAIIQYYTINNNVPYTHCLQNTFHLITTTLLNFLHFLDYVIPVKLFWLTSKFLSRMNVFCKPLDRIAIVLACCVKQLN